MPLIYRRAQQPRLREKILRLLEVSPGEYVVDNLPDFSSHQNLTPALTAIIKARLWKLSQRRLFDRTAARYLKPLDCAGNAFKQNLVSQILLDEGYPSSQGQDVVNEAVELQEMLDEGYCSQKISSKVAPEEDNLGFEEDELMLEEDPWASGLLFGDEDDFLIHDVLWEEQDSIDECALDDDLFYGEESITQDGLGHAGFEWLDDSEDATRGGDCDKIEDEILDYHTHRSYNELLDHQCGNYPCFQEDRQQEDDMLSTS